VHGDVKPSNAIIREHTAKLLDFGLARLVAPKTAPGEAPSASQSLIGGTPWYMAPEQRDGRPPDERSDQFSFCVALADALAGHRIPGRLRRAIARGRADDPRARWPSMAHLAAELRAGADRRLRWCVPGALAMVLPFAFAFSASSSVACETEGANWSDARREALRDGFAAMDRPGAAALGVRVDAHLDRQAQALATAWRAACEHESLQSAEHRSCVADVGEEFRAVTDVMLAGGPAVLARADALVRSLDDPRACSEGMRAPSIPVEQRVAWRVALADGFGAVYEGSLDAARATARRIRGDATAVGASRLAAEAAWLDAAALAAGGSPLAEAALREAIDAAASAEAAVIELGATHDLAVVLFRAGRHQEAELWIRAGLALAERPPGDAAAAARLTVQRASIDRVQGRLDVAEQRFEQALAVLRREYGDDHADIAIARSNLGSVALVRGDTPRAREHYCEAERILAAVRGTGAPQTAEAGLNCALAVQEVEPDRARRRLVDVLATFEATWGPDDTRVAVALVNLALVELRLDDVELALDHLERADAIMVRTLGEDHPHRATVLANSGFAALAGGDPARAERFFLRAHDLTLRLLGAEHPTMADAWTGLAEARLALGNLEAALTAAERGLQLQEDHGVDPSRLAHARVVVAEALLAMRGDLVRAQSLADAAWSAIVDAEGASAERARVRALFDRLSRRSTRVRHGAAR
jgi:tetratricopeptide (TPR) repeat protein